MARGDAVDGSEEVVRGLLFPYWEENLQRGTTSAFQSTEVSVSRLAILSLDGIISILKSDFDHRTSQTGESLKVRAVGVAKVSDILAQADVPVGEGKAAQLPNVVLTVVEDPIKDEPPQSDNPAHASICGWRRDDRLLARKISPGVANRLLKLFQVRLLPE